MASTQETPIASATSDTTPEKRATPKTTTIIEEPQPRIGIGHGGQCRLPSPEEEAEEATRMANGPAPSGWAANPGWSRPSAPSEPGWSLTAPRHDLSGMGHAAGAGAAPSTPSSWITPDVIQGASWLCNVHRPGSGCGQFPMTTSEARAIETMSVGIQTSSTEDVSGTTSSTSENADD